MIFGQTSFRRILLSRLLLVSVPVLLMGVYVTYRKARSAFLETARQNLTESAVRKGESIRQSLEALQTNLVTASDSIVLKFGNWREQQAFLAQLATKLPTQIQCVQLTDLTTGQLRASTCGKQAIAPLHPELWPQERKQLLTNLNDIYVTVIPPTKPENSLPHDSQLQLSLAAPVYNREGKLRYALTLQSALLEREKVTPGSLEGYPVVINQQGTILAHPLPERVGRSVEQEADAHRLQSLINNAIAGREDFLHLFSFEKDGVELVAGYTSIASPVTSELNQQWIVLALSPLNAALSPLQEIQHVLFLMVFALLAASIVAILYISWELARPLEKLRDYALNKENLHSKEQIPQNFRIREFNQLGIAIEEMMKRLQSWGEEIVFSWQEAQNANQLKNEFLATTSHELRTPLNGIIGCLSILKEGYCDSREEELEFLQKADEAAVHLLGIINDILDIAKIEAGKLTAHIEPVNLLQILREAIALQTASIEKKGLQLKIPEWQDGIVVDADPTKLKQVLLNVIGNAVKFTESGNITVRLSLQKEKKKNVPIPQQWAILTITDTGIGIPLNQQDKLFRPFVMVDGSRTRKFGGTGLGLAISRNFMTLMGGRISLFSPGIGLGTTVEISIPVSEKLTAPSTNLKDGNQNGLLLMVRS